METVKGGFSHPFPHLLEWRFKEIGGFVAIGCAMPQYKETFEHNVLTGHELLCMDASRLCAIGIKNVNDQHLILRGIKYLSETGKWPARALGVQSSHQEAPARSMGELPTLRQQMVEVFHRGTAQFIEANPPSFPKLISTKVSDGSLDCAKIHNVDSLANTQMVKKAVRRSLESENSTDANRAVLFLEGLRARDEIRETRKYRKPRQKVIVDKGKGKKGKLHGAQSLSLPALLPAIGVTAYDKDIGHYETINSNTLCQARTMGNFGPGMTPIGDMRYDRLEGIIV
jgi:hypothetical protein